MRGTAQFEGRRNRSASAADDRNFDRLLLGQIIYSHNRILGARAAERNIQYAREYVNRDNAGLRPRPLDRTVPTPHLTPAQPPALASKAYLRAFSDLRAIARDFEVPGRKERVVYGTHVDIPGVRTSSARSRHRRYRGVSAIEICIDHPDLEKPPVGIYSHAGAGSSGQC